MYKIYDEWPKIARKTFESKLESIDFGDIDHIVFARYGWFGCNWGFIFCYTIKK